MARLPNPINIHEPAFNVPVVSLPSPGSAGAEFFGEAAKATARIQEALDTREREDGLLENARESAAIRREYADRMAKDNAEGKIGDTYLEELDQDFQQRVMGRLDEITNPYQRRAFDLSMIDLQTDLHASASGYMAKAAQARKVIGADATLEELKKTAVDHPELAAKSHQDAKTLIDNLELDPAVKIQLYKDADMIPFLGALTEARRDPEGTLKKIENNTLNVPAERVDDINRAAITEQNRRDADKKQKAAEIAPDVADLTKSDVSSIIDTGKPVVEMAGDDIVDGETASQVQSQGPRFVAKWKNAREKAFEVYKAKGDFNAMSEAEMNARITNFAPKPGEKTYDEMKQIQAIMFDNKSKVLAERKADLAGSMVKGFRNVRELWKLYLAAPDPLSLQDAMKATIAAERAVGTREDQLKPLLAPVAHSMANQILDANVDTAYSALLAQQQAAGPHWNLVYNQLRPFLDSNARIAAVMPPGQSANAKLLLRTARGGVPALKKQLGVGDKIRDYLTQSQEVADFTAAVSKLPGGGQFASDLVNATETLALGIKQDRGVDATTAAEQALQATLKSKYQTFKINGRAVYSQAGRDAGAIQRGARLYQNQLTADGLAIADAQGKITPLAGEEALPSIKTYGYWITNHGVKGLYLVNDKGSPIYKHGKPVSLTWEELTSVWNKQQQKELETRVPGAN